ncbi:MAG: hypothetical protein M1837_003141 [Sclerophora amabilis]|nr:MAG: hypothetical protein M1837_003141 [Sclerophora amabilis]
MASEEDNFDIDIYGDGDGDGEEDGNQGDTDLKDAPEFIDADENSGDTHGETNGEIKQEPAKSPEGVFSPTKPGNGTPVTNQVQRIATSDGASPAQLNIPKQTPQQQGKQRKEGSDDRPIEHGATTAILISDLHWWTTDDDIRGWVNQSDCEDELKDVTFHEHKVNGKSKGQAFVELSSPQAASAVKRKIESFNEGSSYGKKHIISFTASASNPFRTLPKDAPARGKDGPRNQDHRSGSAGFSSPGNTNPGPMTFGMSNSGGGGYRGGRGGGNYNNRGGNMNSGSFQNNRSFSGPMGGPAHGGMQGAPMPGFQGGQMGGMPNFGGYQNRGGMMNGMRGGNSNSNISGHRAGRGSIPPQHMIGNMPNIAAMSGMAMGIPMSSMSGNMGMGSMNMQGMNGFNPAAAMTGGANSPTMGTYMGRGGAGPLGQAVSANHTAAGSPSQMSPLPFSWAMRPNAASASSPPTVMAAAMPNMTLKRDFCQSTGQGGFQQQQNPAPHFNPNFFNQSQGAGGGGGGDGGNWNPHGAKRPRPE